MMKETRNFRAEVFIYSARSQSNMSVRSFIVVADNIEEAVAKVRAYGEEQIGWKPIDGTGKSHTWDTVPIDIYQLTYGKTKVIR